MKHYWLHRISHHYDVSKPLLDKGYLTIGFADFLTDKKLLSNMLDDNFQGDKVQYLKDLANKSWGPGDVRTIHNLKRFLCEFKAGDWVLVPSSGVFSVYEITGPVMEITDLPQEILQGLKVLGSGASVSLHDDDFIFYGGDEKNFIDLGYAWRVKLVDEKLKNYDIPRDFADTALTSRMKIRQTNAKISDLAESIKKAIKYFKDDTRPNIHMQAMDAIAETFNKTLQKELGHSDKLEKLIAWYFQQTGADETEIPSKNAQEAEKGDADVIATFKSLNICIMVQAKLHNGETDDWSVTQIKDYAAIKEAERQVLDTEYHNILWVISTCDKFTDKAILEAEAAQVRLINGKDFAVMLLNAGIKNINNAFNV